MVYLKFKFNWTVSFYLATLLRRDFGEEGPGKTLRIRKTGVYTVVSEYCSTRMETPTSFSCHVLGMRVAQAFYECTGARCWSESGVSADISTGS